MDDQTLFTAIQVSLQELKTILAERDIIYKEGIRRNAEEIVRINKDLHDLKIYKAKVSGAVAAVCTAVAILIIAKFFG
jgi:hypothetical protein